MSGCQHKVLLKGICMAEDKTRAKRAALEGSLAAAERDHENVVDALERDFTQDAKRFVVIVTCMTAMVLLVNSHVIPSALAFCLSCS